MKDKLILFDWGNIVESHTTVFSCKDALNETFRECGNKGEKDIFRSLGMYKLNSIKTEEDFATTYELMKKEFNFNTSFEEFIEIYKRVFDKIDYYKDVQSKLPFSGEDILFIDDRSDNVDAALKAGWNALQATGLELSRIKEKCEEFLNN